ALHQFPPRRSSDLVGTGALSPARLAEAASRVARLARSVGARPVAPDRDGDLPDPARLVAAFDVRPGAAPPAGARIVQIGTSPNVAVGGVPWGPAATGITVDMVHPGDALPTGRSEEHTSELQSRENLVCRLLLEKKKTKQT